MSRICVFCGASNGNKPEYRATAKTLGRLLAGKQVELVYGGGNIGLMGVVADACLDAGGRVIGVIPESLVGREVAGRSVEHNRLTRLEIVDSMHTRKARMAELSDGFVALPGGFGTFEELFEILTWAQLGFHAKPIGVINVLGYFDTLLSLCDQAVTEEFLRPDNRELLLAATCPEVLLHQMTVWQNPGLPAWVQSADQL